MKNHDEKMSFLPEDYVQRRIERRTNLTCLSLFAVVLAGVVGAYAVTSRHRSEIKEQRQAINNAYSDAAKRLEQLNKLQQQKQQMLRKAQITGMLIEPVPRSFLLADLINRMPKALSLFELKMKSSLLRPVVTVDPRKTALANKAKSKIAAAEEEPVPRYQVSLTLVGVAPTDVQVAQYMASLSRSPLMSDVNLMYSEETTIAETTMRRFRIEAALNQSADVRSLNENQIDLDLKKNPMDVSTPASPGDKAPVMPHTVVDGTPAGEE